jgi:hypothetical protein
LTVVTKVEKGQGLESPMPTFQRAPHRPRSILLLMLFLAPLMASAQMATAQCVEPFDGMILSSSRTLCQGEFVAENIQIEGTATSVECDQTVLKGNGNNAGVLIEYAQNTLIKGCTFQDFEAGISVRNSQNIVIESNAFIGNKIGISEIGSSTIQRNNSFVGSIRQDVLSIESSQLDEETATEPILERLSSAVILRKQLTLKNPDANEEEIAKKVNEFLEKAQLSEELLDIIRTIDVNEDDKTTTITLSISPKHPLSNVSIYEGIPKCLEEYLGQIVFSDGSFEVIEEDPLIMWSFSGMNEKSRLSYVVRRVVSEECLDLLTGFGIATLATPIQKKEKEAPKETKGSSIAFGIVVLLFGGLILHRAVSKTHRNE